MKNEPHHHLSEKALKGLKKIYRQEFDETLPDDEVEEMGLRLLWLFDIFLPEPKVAAPILVELTEQERKVVELVRMNPKASVRETTTMLGLKSSRSGFLVLKRLIRKGILIRDEREGLKVISGK